MNSKYFPWLVWIILLLSSTSACSSDSEAAQGPIRVAVLAPFSGDFNPLGQSTRNGVIIAVEEWNQRGGVSGRPIELVLGDTYCDAEKAEDVSDEMINQDIRFIIGAVCSDASLAIAQVASQRGVLQISPATTVSDLTLNEAGVVRPWVFRACFTDAFQGAAMANFALEQLNARRAGILYEGESSYGASLADAFEDKLIAGDGEILARGTYDREQRGEVPQALVEIRDARPEVLYLPGYYSYASEMLLQARMNGITATVLGSDGWHTPQLDPAAVEGMHLAVHYYNGEPRRDVQTWIRKYQDRYIAVPDAVATLAYDAAYILFSAMETAEEITPQTVAEAMASSTFNIVSGPLLFDEFHNPIKPVVILRVWNQNVTYMDRILP
jgi:branched-chain amino acid transport system substrate-binding protein